MQAKHVRSNLAYAYLASLLAVLVVGIGALVIRTTEGLRVTNLSNLVGWGLWVAFYIYFIGLSAGSFLLSTLIYVFGYRRFEPIGRLAVFSAFIALLAGLGFIWLDLGHLERFYTVFVNRSASSVLEWEIHFYLLYTVVLAAELWLLMRPDLVGRARGEGGLARLARILTLGSWEIGEAALRRDRRWIAVLGAIGIPVAIGVHGGTGAIFAVVEARPYWYSGLFPIIFLVSALVSGGALLTFVAALRLRPGDARGREMIAELGRLVAGLLALDLLLLSSEILVAAYGSVPDLVATYRAILFGPFWWVFWIQQLALGAALPLALLLLPATRRSPRWVGGASLLIVVGIFGVRLNIVIPPLTVPVLPGLERAYGAGLQVPAPDYNLLLRPWLVVALAILLAAPVAAAVVALLRPEVAGEERPARRPGPAWAIPAVLTFGLAALVVQSFSAAPSALGPAPTWLLSPGGLGGVSPQRLSTDYFPSLIEWLSSAGVLALTVLAFVLGVRLLPLEEQALETGARPRFGPEARDPEARDRGS